MNLKLTTLVSALALAATGVLAEDGTVVSKASEQISVKADLRVRYENRHQDNAGAEDSRNRLRTRFRLGLDFKTAYGWTAHAGLASGGNSGTSTNDTWNETSTWETGDIRLDYAYVQHTFESDTKLTIGQQKNPFINTGILWDGDLRPTGLIGQQGFGPGFLTAGYLNMGYSGGSAMAEALGLQAGVKSKGAVSFTAAAAYYHGNGQTAKDIFGAATDYEFQYFHLYGDLGFKAGDSADVTLFAEVGMNMGADDVDTQLAGAPAGYEADENNMLYTLGTKAKLANNVSVSAQYFSVDGDGAFLDLSSSDLGDIGAGGTDIKGYTIAASYAFTKNAKVGASYWVSESIERDDVEADMFRIDVQYKF